jgi:hypothetical protein
VVVACEVEPIPQPNQGPLNQDSKDTNECLLSQFMRVYLGCQIRENEGKNCVCYSFVSVLYGSVMPVLTKLRYGSQAVAKAWM